MAQWEYKTLELDTAKRLSAGNLNKGELDSQMNDLGTEGWELVSAFDMSKTSGSSTSVVAIFKREKGTL